MFVYPARVSAAARASINAAVIQADDAFDGWASTGLVWVGGVIQSTHPDTRDRIALDYLLTVADAVIHTLCPLAQDANWTTDDLRRTVDDLVQQRVVWTHTHQHSQRVAIDAFARQVDRAIQARASWVQLASCEETLASEPPRDEQVRTDRPGRDSTPSDRPTLAQQLKALRREAHWTQEALAAAFATESGASIDVRTVRRHLSGDVTPRPDAIGTYEKIFRERLHRDVKLLA